jgi:acyl carrier protein
MGTNSVDLVTMFQEAVYETDGRTLAGLTLDTRLSQLAMDSVAMMEAIGLLEQRMSLRFGEDELAKVKTLRDLEALIAKAPR